ncbi:XRE family transcriptional regulator [Pseudomonas sp. A25(2017)]|uniref:S24 family peptidase n=1 Tax=Pseudomonas sp. A25(2017) TaxID=1945865 RepID=UPI00098788F1|nr:helix-turn-helix transcriptional regulator [Pseudomonas sp. A25(2017)]OOG85731.1 XRE family transcriptional regulator [Pseudomonas sp. A25(2017)]
MNFSERVKERMAALGLRATDISERTGVSRTTVSFWLSGTNGAKGKNLLSLAKALDCSPEWLSSGAEPVQAGRQVSLSSIAAWDDETPLDDDEVYVPFLEEVELAAGSGRFAIEESDSARLRFYKKDLRNNNVQFSNAKCVMVSGNSMVPVLRDGATVGINVGKNSLRDVVDGEMYAINHNGQLRVKQLYRLPTGIRLRSFNRDEHPDEDYTFQDIQDQQIVILGHVFWWAMYSRSPS